MSIDTSYKMRLSGLATGLDTDSIIENLMTIEKMPIDKLSQKKQVTEWKRDEYRNITSKLSSFHSEFLDSLSTTNMRSANSYKNFTSSVVNSATGSTSSAVSATGSKDASPGSHKMIVNNIATYEEVQSSENITAKVNANSIADWATAQGKSFTLDIDGTKKTIDLDSLIVDASTEVQQLEDLISNSFGSNKISVSTDGNGYLSFDVVEGSGVNKITLTTISGDDALSHMGFGEEASFSNRLSLSSTLEDISSKLNTTLTFDSSDNINLTINDEDFSFSKDTTLKSMMNQINNNSDANVYMKYDEINDKITFSSKQTGEGVNIKLEETDSNFLSSFGLNSLSSDSVATSALQNYNLSNKSFTINIDGTKKTITLDDNYTSFGTDSGDANSELTAALKSKIESAFSGITVSVSEDSDKLSINLTSGGNSLSIGEPESGTSAISDLGLTANYIAGEDAQLVLDGESLTRSSNNFTVDGVDYTLNKETEAGEEDISLSLDVDSIYDKIKTYIDKYNVLVDEIHEKLNEDYDKNYLPLTDAQKESMSEDDIKVWESKAKTGLLKNDSTLENLLNSMRRGMYESIDGATTTLYSIGISSKTYSDNGKLTIDESTLKDALREDIDSVMNLFSQQSTTHPGTTTARKLSSDEKQVRYEESGISYRLYDIIESNISIISDSGGNKGALLEKAGMIGDSSEFDNVLYKQLRTYSTDITDLLDKLTDKENSYYKQYASLEKAISQMNSQGDWLMSQINA